MALMLGDLASYVGLMVSAPVFVNRVPDSPDEMVMVSMVHGSRGFIVDGAFQEAVIHVRSRATTDTAAEALAYQVDNGILNSTPVMVGACQVRNAYPVGGPPCYFERDDNNRTVYFCDYMMEVSR